MAKASEKIGKILSLLIPLTAIVYLLHLPEKILFFLSLFSIIYLAEKAGHATEELSKHLGPQLGGFLNSTMGNVAEIIIAISALNKGLVVLVKASLVGSIISNILLVGGLSFLVGGLKYKRQRFSKGLISLIPTMLLIAVLSILIPSIIYAIPGERVHEDIYSLSLVVAVLLFILYLAGLIFSFITHKHLFESYSKEKPSMSKEKALLMLVGCVGLMVFFSEIFVGTVEKFISELGLSELFIGAIVVALMGNAAEHFSAIVFAYNNKLDLSINISLGSALQITLFVLPIIVLYGFFVEKPIDIVFTIPEAIALIVSTFVILEIIRDREVNWFEGAQLIMMYMIIATFFFFYK